MKPWRLYHFTSEKQLAQIKKFGITEGVLALSTKPDPDNLKKDIFEHMRGVQWLTSNPEFIPMTAPHGPPRSSMYPGRKAEYRVTVKIPKDFRRNTPAWTLFARIMREGGYRDGDKTFRLDPKMEREINLDLGNPAEWFVFCGPIVPPAWISSPTPNPSLPRAVADLRSA